MHNPVRPILYAVDGEHAEGGAREGAERLAAGGDGAGMSAEELVAIAYGSDEDQQGEALGERIPENVRRPNATTKAMIDEHFPCHADFSTIEILATQIFCSKFWFTLPSVVTLRRKSCQALNFQLSQSPWQASKAAFL